MLTTPTANKDKWIINKTKVWITNVHESSAVIVFAMTDIVEVSGTVHLLLSLLFSKFDWI
jgi:alkylation response protein AidB-like acyl-CoA dehydrogenase